MRISQGRPTESGYSIAELLTVVAIIGILSLIAVPQFASMYRSSVTKSSMRDFTSALRKARQLAVTRGERTRVILTPGTAAKGSYEIDTGGALISSPTWVLYPRSARNLATGMYFDTSSTLPANASRREVDFLPSGLACSPDDSSSATDPTVPLPTANNSIVLRSSYKNMAFNQYTITLTTSGGVSVAQFKWQ